MWTRAACGCEECSAGAADRRSTAPRVTTSSAPVCSLMNSVTSGRYTASTSALSVKSATALECRAISNPWVSVRNVSWIDRPLRIGTVCDS